MEHYLPAPPENTGLRQLTAQIEPHLGDPDLSISRLTRLLAMSRTKLHRKLKSYVGMSASAYIRCLRIRKAADLLLRNPEWSVFQVAMEVGFANQSYFSKCFKNYFNISPTLFRRQNRSLKHMI